MMPQLPTLHSRLARRAFSYTALVLVLVAVVGWLTVDRVVSEQASLSARDYLLTLTSELEIAASPKDPNVLAPIEQPGADRIAQIVDLSSGEILAATPGLARTPLIEPSALAIDSEVGRMVPGPGSGSTRLFLEAATVTVGGESLGVIAGVESGPPLVENGGAVLVVIGSAFLIALGLAAAVWLSVRSALRPVELLADEADHIASDTRAESWALENRARTEEIDHLVNRLNSLLARVHESQENERAFLEDASHDLRTPIAVARAELDLASSTTSESDTFEALRSAIEELDRLDRLTADLLLLARMRAHPTKAEETVHLGYLIRQTTARTMREPHHPQLDVTVEGHADAVGDPFMLERAIDNLVSNALRHAERRVCIEVDAHEGVASIRVSDDGAGFNQALISSAAERFVRDTNRREGAGLGLSIAAAIAAAHGGSLTLRNKPDGGAEVTLRIQTADVQEDAGHSVHGSNVV